MPEEDKSEPIQDRPQARKSREFILGILFGALLVVSIGGHWYTNNRIDNLQTNIGPAVISILKGIQAGTIPLQ